MNGWCGVEHFQWNGELLVGRTAIGRATIDVLKINDRFAVQLRRQIQSEE